MSIGSRIKERREAIGMKQEELAAILGVSKGAVGNYEADYNLPKATMIVPLAQALKTDPNFLFQDGAFFGKDSFTEKEKTIIKIYRALDQRGKNAIKAVLESEYREVVLSSGIVIPENIDLFNSDALDLKTNDLSTIPINPNSKENKA